MSSCPLTYRLGAARFRSCPTIPAHTVFTVGGLYGNPHALSAVLARAAREQTPSVVVFNGDFNFFNAEPDWWSEMNAIIRHGGRDQNRGMVRLLATQGNVEVEASAATSQGVCGCGYPSYVAAGVVGRSDEIVEQLRAAAHHPSADASILPWLRSLPPALSVDVTACAPAEPPKQSSSARIAILHGDPDSLSGWGLSAEAVDADVSNTSACGVGHADGVALAARATRADHVVQQVRRRLVRRGRGRDGEGGVPRGRVISEGSYRMAAERAVAPESYVGWLQNWAHLAGWAAGRWGEQSRRPTVSPAHPP